MQKDLVFHLHSRKYVRDYDRTVSLMSHRWSRELTSWMYPVLERLSEVSGRKPLPSQKWDAFQSACKLLPTLKCWGGVTRSHLLQIREEHLLGLLFQLESRLLEVYPEKTAYNSILAFREFLLAYLETSDIEPRIIVAAKLFKPRIFPKPNRRGAISPKKGSVEGIYFSEDENFKNVEELKNLTLTQHQNIINDITQACLKELDEYEAFLGNYYFIQNSEISKDELSWLKNFFRETRKGNPHRAPPLSHYDLIIKYYFKVESGILPRPVVAPEFHAYYPHSNLLADRLCEMLNTPKRQFYHLICADIYPPSEVLVAVLLLLQIKTRWNISSVLELKSSNISGAGQKVQIQSIKSRTKDDTPVVLIEKEDTGTLRAISLLTRRLDLLKKRGRVDESEDRLWIGRRRDSQTKLPTQMSGWSALLKHFIKKYELPDFSPEQVRTHTLQILALSKGNPFAASEAAGHAEIGVVSRYLGDGIFDQLNDAVNLDFQRRWARTIKYVAEGLEPTSQGNTIPIGDGSSCSAPANPPDEAWLKGGICEGKNCHLSDGCTNRRIQLDEDRIEEVVRTKKYYNDNWLRLMNKNIHEFKEIHLPNMIFNTILFGFIKIGPLRHLVRKYENQ